MKKLLFALVVGIVITTAVGVYAQTTQNKIADSLVRLHIIANSDSAQDQAVKLNVRDAVIAAMREKFAGIESPAQAEKIISENIPYIEDIANSVLRKQGYGYHAVASVGNYSFPVKQYQNITLPAGNYDALRLVLGEGGGKNWWCVMFPPLCFVDGAKGEASQNSLAILKENITADAYDIITASDESRMPVQIKFKIVELWNESTRDIFQAKKQ